MQNCASAGLSLPQFVQAAIGRSLLRERPAVAQERAPVSVVRQSYGLTKLVTNRA